MAPGVAVKVSSIPHPSREPVRSPLVRYSSRGRYGSPGFLAVRLTPSVGGVVAAGMPALSACVVSQGTVRRRAARLCVSASRGAQPGAFPAAVMTLAKVGAAAPAKNGGHLAYVRRAARA
jgi:hypothetical protein